MNSILIIGQLLEAVGAVEGRKKFQKLVHILQHLGMPFHFRFGYLHYGPYSSELDGQLQAFEGEGLINEEPLSAGIYKTYRFTAREGLKQLVSQLAGDKALPLADLAKGLNEKTSQELEAISTIYYLQNGGKQGSELKESFCALKPKFAPLFEIRLKTARELEKKVKKAA
ncbi:hypothetical protein [Prosthecobacter sp.]|uniref:hypothetical protein n=1 Tax=Prosthecobacter sp. TaxID=1965333 RepID=UPI002486D88C|nr:hypothetical protein [Prosthecobacter sp.]MDI1315132.1 hypothetical protein [Prosthecobacter sp.]